MSSSGAVTPHNLDPLPADGDGARQFSEAYPVWLCDVWGVVHDGVRAYRAACEALERHRARGGIVVLITNAPRPSRMIVPYLDSLGVDGAAYDAVVSSGDVTMKLVGDRATKVFYLGPERDAVLGEDAQVEFTALEAADVVLCTGLVHDDTEKPEEYLELLHRMRSRRLPMICANPDKVVRRGDTLVPCAGALAEVYEGLGGETIMAGKPFAPIYDAALERASACAGRTVARHEVLAIGDGLATDVEGAARNGLDLLFIIGGIHEAELAAGGPGAPADMVRQAVPEVRLHAVMEALRW